MACTAGARGDNANFCVNAKSDAITENEDSILQASAHLNQNKTPRGVELVLNLLDI